MEDAANKNDLPIAPAYEAKIGHDTILLGIGLYIAAKSLTAHQPLIILVITAMQICYLGYLIYCQQDQQLDPLSTPHPIWGKYEYFASAGLWLATFMYLRALWII